MLSRRFVYRFCHYAALIASTDTPVALSNNIRNPKSLEEPALVKLKAERDPEKLFHLFKVNATNRLVIENRFAFEDTVSRLAGAKRFDYIEHLLEHQKTLPQGRREGFIVRIIMLYGHAGMTKHAINTFHDMHLYGCNRTVKSFNAALKVLTKTHDIGAIESFLKQTREFDIELDIISVNIVVKAFCDLGVSDKASIVMLEMEKRGVKPDVITYTTLISAFYKNNQWEIGNGLWNLMVLRRCLPNVATFNVRIQYLINKKRAWEANRLVGLMQNCGIVPDEVTYNLIIKGFFQAGFSDMAKRVYSSLHGKGYKPNVKIYQTMLHYLCKSGDFNLAYTLCKDCMNKNWFPNVETIHTLLEGLKKNGELGKARFIMKLARRRIPPFSSNQLGALINVLSKS